MRPRSHTFAIVGAAAATAAVTVAVPAHAAPAVPKQQPQTLGQFDAGVFCDVPVEIAVLDGTKPGPSAGGGRVLSTGPLSVTVTNLDTGLARTFNASGPTMVDARSGNLVLTGPALVGQPASRDLGSTFLRIYRGRTVFTADNTVASHSGTVVDICAAIS